MFTGIIEELRPVISVVPGGASGKLAVDLGRLADGTKLGDSIAIDGICLTVSALHSSTATFDVSTETLSKTAFAALAPGRRVNVERSLRVGDRLGGHFVTGHIDGTGQILTKRRDPGQWTFEFQVSPDLSAMLIEKGSVAIDGISLTVVDLRADRFAAAVIPHTFDTTTLGIKPERTPVNIETDVLGKWVKKLVTGARPGQGDTHPGASTLTEEKLRQTGFI